jgi:hypothetical protein
MLAAETVLVSVFVFINVKEPSASKTLCLSAESSVNLLAATTKHEATIPVRVLDAFGNVGFRTCGWGPWRTTAQQKL